MEKMERIKTGYDRMHERLFASRIKKFGGAKGVFFDRLRTPWHRLASRLLSGITIKDRSILDVGCGYGVFSMAITQHGAQVTSLDLSKRATEIAKDVSEKLNIKIAIIQGDAQNIPCVSSVFDMIVSCETLEHMPDLRKALAEMFRCIKLGGCMLLTFPNVINPIGIYQRIASKQPFERSLSMNLMIREIRKLGNMEIIMVEATYDFGFLQRIEQHLPKGLGSRIGLVVEKTSEENARGKW